MTNYFTYEKNNVAQWIPVVYHDSKPHTSVNGSSPERFGMWEAGPEHFDFDGTPNFKSLMTKYPRSVVDKTVDSVSV